MSRCVRACALAVPLLAVTALGGCSGSSGEGTVNGEVLLDNQPLKKGVIKFAPTDGKSAAVEAPITDGKFTAKVPVGEAKVKVSATKVVGKRKMYDTPDSPEVEQGIEIHPRFTDGQTEKKITVQRGTQEQKFEVQGK